MENTYDQLYRLPGGLFLDNAPVFVKEGALWQHKEESTVHGAITMKNIDCRTVAAVTVRFCPIAPNGAVIGDGVVREFTGLQIEPNGYFLGDDLTELPEGCCAFGLAVLQVRFADGTDWKAENRLAWHVADESYNPQAPVK